MTGVAEQGKDGEPITGSCTFDVNSQDATAQVAEILTGKTAYARGTKLTGTMPNNGGVTGTINTVTGENTIAQEYHNGSGKVSIDPKKKKKIIAANIKQGVQILGVTGTLEPSSDVTVQSKSATPTTSEQTILPDPGYDYLSQVTIAAIPYSESPNSAGGITVTIAG